MNAANIGVSWWSHDVGGNHGGIEESELYIRYLELSVYSPILRFHEMCIRDRAKVVKMDGVKLIVEREENK